MLSILFLIVLLFSCARITSAPLQYIVLFVLNVTVLFCVPLYRTYVNVIVQFSCFLIIMDNCQNSTFLTGVKTLYTMIYMSI